MVALRGDHSEELRAALAAQPLFDEIYVLAKGPWLPDGWDLRRDGLDNISGPIWKLARIWPFYKTGVEPTGTPPALGQVGEGTRQRYDRYLDLG